MFSFEEYLEAGEKVEVLALKYQACRFEGNLYPRKAGGFDLFLFRDNSEFECLEIDKITWLRHQAPDGSLFIERFADKTLSRDMKGRVEAAFAKWLETNLGLPIGGQYKCAWGVE